MKVSRCSQLWRDLPRKAAQSSFVERSGIPRDHPRIDVPVEASEPAAYAGLLRQIDTHHYFMSRE